MRSNARAVLQTRIGLKGLRRYVELEEELIEALGDLGYVDGHDARRSEMNIFVPTDDPAGAFERVKASERAHRCIAGMKAAFREIGQDDYTIIPPKDLASFSVT